jgi:hypothetical protein
VKSKETYLRALIRKEIHTLLEITKIKSAQAKIDASKAEMQIAQDELKAAQALKEDEILLTNLLEAEEDKAEEPAEEPAAEEETPPADEEAPAEEGGSEGEEGGDKEAKPAPQETGPEINFNISAVKKYNDALFRSNTGIVKKISKDGMEVKVMPDDVDIFVTFDDITESVKKFFKNK